MILIDSNILIDLVEKQGHWHDWSVATVRGVARDHALAVNLVVRAETARQFVTLAEQQAFLDDLRIADVPIRADAAFRAGRAHAAYRAAGGERSAILADFLIGSHASALDATLLTRDRARFAVYFPELTLITPETHP